MTNTEKNAQKLTKELRRLYNDKMPAFQRAKKKLRQNLNKVVKSIEDRDLVRAKVVGLRIKDFDSFRSKVMRKSWSAEESMAVCSDLVGGRVVCNNVEDVRRFAELLKENSADVRPLIDEEDFILQPQEKGYRALHLELKLNANESTFDYEIVPCEVQIRTLLQDAWAQLAHDDIYKQKNLPEDLEARATDLAEVLAAADRIAGNIRSRAMQERTAPAKPPVLDVISGDALSYLFKKYFGRSPADYAVRQATNLCEQLGIHSLEELPKYLNNDGNEGFPEDVRLAHLEILGPISNETVFLAALRAAANGKSEAIQWVCHQARQEIQEYEQISYDMMLSELPETIGEFVEDIESPHREISIEQVATALGATDKCHICNTTIIDPYSFAEGVIQHYHVPALNKDEVLSETELDEDEVLSKIQKAVVNSGVEIGGSDNSSVCAYHYESTLRDD